MINELEMMYKEAVVALFEVLVHHLAGGTEKTGQTSVMRAGIRADSPLGPPEYETGVLTTLQRRSVAKSAALNLCTVHEAVIIIIIIIII
jgi:hypothetical protein